MPPSKRHPQVPSERAKALIAKLERGEQPTDLNEADRAFLALLDAGRSYTEAAQELEDATALRDATILVASENGYPRRMVANAAGVTVGRVQQVLTGAHREKRLHLAESIIAIAARQLPPAEAQRYEAEWLAELAAMDDRPRRGLAFAIRVLSSSRALKRELPDASEPSPRPAIQWKGVRDN